MLAELVRRQKADRDAGSGLPRHKYISINCDTLEAPGNVWRHNMSLPTTLGSCVSMPLKVGRRLRSLLFERGRSPSSAPLPRSLFFQIQAMSAVDELTPQAQAIGSCNTTFFRAEEDGRLTHVGTNTDAAGVSCSLVTALTGISTPFPPSMPLAFAPGTASALMIGGGGATRAAIYALHAMGLSPIYLVNRDAEETAGIVEHFKEWDLRSLETLQAAQEALAQADRDGVKLVAAVGAIPSVEPVTEEEKRVYEIAGTLFGHEYEEGGATLGERYLPLPSKPVQ